MHDGAMATSDELPLTTVGWEIDERRAELGMRWQDLAEAAGVSRQRLYEIRDSGSASSRMRTTTKKKIERALQWERGSIDAILRGGDPTPISAPEDEWAPRDELERSLKSIPGLTQADYRRLVQLHRHASTVEDAALTGKTDVHPDSGADGNNSDTE